MAKAKDYFQYNSFSSMLSESKKYKELYKGHAAQFSFFVSVIITSLTIMLYYQLAPDKLTIMLSTLILAIAAGLIGLLGFLITGVAILAALITKQAMDVMDDEGSVHNLVGILFSFYFAGSIVAVAILMYLVTYLLLQFELDFIDVFYWFMSGIDAYLLVFSLIYTVALLGTCINAFFVNCKLTQNYNEKHNKLEFLSRLMSIRQDRRRNWRKR